MAIKDEGLSASIWLSVPCESEVLNATAAIGPELTDSEILARARVHRTLPPGIKDPAAKRTGMQFAKGARAIGFHFRVAIWPDGILLSSASTATGTSRAQRS